MHKKRRRKNDFYETPPDMTRVLLSTLTKTGMLNPDEQELLFDPVVGNGNISNMLRAQNRTVVTNDINPSHVADYHMDAGDLELWETLVNDCTYPKATIMNPPFSQVERILPYALAYTYGFVACAARITYHEPTKARGGWLHEMADNLRYQIVFGQPRPRFRSSGTDSATTMWLVWDKTWSWKRNRLNCPFQYAMRWEA